MQAQNSAAVSSFTAQNKVQLIRGGKSYFDLLLQLVANAKESIHLQTYIDEGDETGYMVTEALKAATKRNVQVYLLTDGYASQSTSKRVIHELKIFRLKS